MDQVDHSFHPTEKQVGSFYFTFLQPPFQGWYVELEVRAFEHVRKTLVQRACDIADSFVISRGWTVNTKKPENLKLLFRVVDDCGICGIEKD